MLLHPITARVSIHYLYALFDSKLSPKLSSGQGAETKSSNDIKNSAQRENGAGTTVKQHNKAVKRWSANARESDDSKTTSPSGPSEAEHSTDTDGDGAEADDENEENEPKKGNAYFIQVKSFRAQQLCF